MRTFDDEQLKRSDWRGPIWILLLAFCGASWVMAYRLAEYLVYLSQVART
ncbi:hypothetical protein G6M87_11075 [Rhizobium rhizogenes]|nr:hypothetical protein [Rhizobium rhizogenes]NTI22400.1 hypothetical protein [Rhizobium rhizogenes]QTG05984.1 hypothetical protein G6M87_11075 [Rhizobium rhizogenes]